MERGGGECAHSSHLQSEPAAVKKNSRASGGGGRDSGEQGNRGGRVEYA